MKAINTILTRLEVKAGTTGVPFLNQDDSSFFAALIGKAVGIHLYEAQGFLALIAAINPKKFKKVVDKAKLQKAISPFNKYFEKTAQMLAQLEKTRKEHAELESAYRKEKDERQSNKLYEKLSDTESYLEGLEEYVCDAADSSNWNPWPMNLVPSILAAVCCGYPVPKAWLKIYGDWVQYEKARKTRTDFVNAFQAVLDAATEGKIAFSAVGMSNDWAGFQIEMLAESKEAWMALVKRGILPKGVGEDPYLFSVEKESQRVAYLKKFLKEWKSMAA